jgi:hypothetical protein
MDYPADVLPPPANARPLPPQAAPLRTAPIQTEPSHSILEENWNIPKSRPVPGRPIHKAQQPPRAQMSQRSPAIGSGVRQANYLR